MPLPRSVAHFNKRFTNKYFVRLLRRTPGFATVEHRGRNTGAPYRTPVYVFGDDDGRLLVSLTYGPSADWAENVTAGGGGVERRGETQPIASATVVDRETAWPHLPWIVRTWLRILKVNDFMQLDMGSTHHADG